MSTTRGERDTRIHQVVFRWTDQHLLGGRGIGPVGTSLPEQRDLARWSDLLDNGDLVGPLRPGRPALGLLRPRSRSGLAVVVRADAVPTSSRGSHQVHALVGAADVLTARLALGLRDWAGWLPPQDGPLPDPRLPALDPAAVDAAYAPPGRPDPQEVAALLRHVLHHPDYHFHFAGADSDPYALGHALACLLDVSLIVEGDVQAASAQPRIAVTEEKTNLHIPPSHWYRKSPASRAPLEEWADDIGYLVDQALADPPRITPSSPQERRRGLSDLHYRREGLYWLLLRALQGDAQVRRYLTQDDTLHWARQHFPELAPDELAKLCRAWGGWANAPQPLTGLLRDRVAALALDWRDDRERDSLRDAGRQVFPHPAPETSAQERRAQLRPVTARMRQLWRDRQGRPTADFGVLLWHAHRLARLSTTEVRDLLRDLEVPAATLIVFTADYTGDAAAREFRRGVLAALHECPATQQDRQKVRTELRRRGFLLDALADETAERRQALFTHLLEAGYGPPETGRSDPQLSRQLNKDLADTAGHRLFASLLPVVARRLHVKERLRLWSTLRSTLTGREAAVLLDGADTYLADGLLASRTLADFRETLDVLVELRRADALPTGDFQRMCWEHDHFQEKLYAFRGADNYGQVGEEIILAFADLMWLASGEVPPLRGSRALSERKAGELERAERYGRPAYFRLALIRVSRTESAHTPVSERLWRMFPPEVVESFQDRPGLMRVVGEPPATDDQGRSRRRKQSWPPWHNSKPKDAAPPLDLASRAPGAPPSRGPAPDGGPRVPEAPHAPAGRDPAAEPHRTPGHDIGPLDFALTEEEPDDDTEVFWERPEEDHRQDADTATARPNATAGRRGPQWLFGAKDRKPKRDPEPETWSRYSAPYQGMSIGKRLLLAAVAVVGIVAAVTVLVVFFVSAITANPVTGDPPPDRSGSATPAPAHSRTPAPTLADEETPR